MTQEQIQEMHNRFDDTFGSRSEVHEVRDKVIPFIEQEINKAFDKGIEASAAVLRLAISNKFK